jgi:hypothetical protein
MSRRALLPAALALLITSCQQDVMKEAGPALHSFDSISKNGLTKLMSSRIFFGHQSVGYNIIEGLQNVLGSRGLPVFAVVETRTPEGDGKPCFHHSTIGANGDPLGKIRDFELIMRSGMGGSVDIAFMKLCYADIGPGADIQTIFTAYRDSMARLKAAFPKVTFIHVTTPITTRETGLISTLKGALGRQLQGYGDNVAREKLNSLMRAEYEGKGLFDLALYESTGPDGMRTRYNLAGQPYYTLHKVYTDDGGHLNGRGRGYIAEQLLAFLGGF